MNTRSNISSTIGILGANGLLGSDLVEILSKDYKTDKITRENYEKKKGTSYKVLINANGNSKRFWANKNPLDDFFFSTVSVYQSIFDFNCNLYTYISSPDVYENHSSPEFAKENQIINSSKLQPYGLHKYLSELIIKQNKKKFIILRCSMVLGKNLKKGPFYDIIHDIPLSITLNTKLQLVTTHAIADIIKTLLESSVVDETINIGGIGYFDFTKIKDYLNKEIKVSKNAESQFYEMNVSKLKKLYPQLKTSEDYLQDFLNNYL